MGPVRDVLILAPYLPHQTPPPWQRRVLRTQFDVARALHAELHLVPTPRAVPDAYAEALQHDATVSLSSAQRLVVWEHDIEPQVADLIGLLDCPSPHCTSAYRLYPVSTGLGAEVWAQSSLVTGPWPDARYLAPILAARTGLGLVALKGIRALELVRHNALGSWLGLDVRVSVAVSEGAGPWCVHPEVRHNHRLARPDDGERLGPLRAE